jgi:hypothetical protein
MAARGKPVRGAKGGSVTVNAGAARSGAGNTAAQARLIAGRMKGRRK